jgi:ribonucleotide monophosphatase NagD (HAD superfamily)
MIGDKLNSDILCAKNSGLDSCLTLSGYTKRDDINTSDDVYPTYVIEKLM